MERLTKRHGKHAVQIEAETRRNDPGWQRLAEIEDLAEQGRLVELPCAVGDMVYTVNDKFDECYRCEFAKKHEIEEGFIVCKEFCKRYGIKSPKCPPNHYEIQEHKCEGFEYTGKPLTIEDAGKIGYEGIEWFYGEDGKVYKTQEEAEERLAELEEAE